MTFQALFKWWCTTKSFCLMGSHFEKWQRLWVVGLFPVRTNIIWSIVRFHLNKSFFLKEATQMSMLSISVLNEWKNKGMNDDILINTVESTFELCPWNHLYISMTWRGQKLPCYPGMNRYCGPSRCLNKRFSIGLNIPECQLKTLSHHFIIPKYLSQLWAHLSCRFFLKKKYLR